MGDIPGEGHHSPGCSVGYLITICDTSRAFYNKNVFVLILVDVHWGAIAPVLDMISMIE
jgi:hypothetical protein